MQIYLVGGAVRDKLLQYPVRERDWVVVGANPEYMTEQGFKPVGKDFPVFLHPETHEEYALARTERKRGHGYKGFTFHADRDVSLEEDLVRRDLTINAIALSESGEYIDPYGGRKDIKDRVLRHVSPAFVEDPVRVLRVARFAARYHHLGFSIATETLALMQNITDSGELDYLVAERVWQEIRRALEGAHSWVFIQALRDSHALKKLLPEIDSLFGVPQPAQHHPEIDTGVHCLLTLKAICTMTEAGMTRFAALVHDLGKGTSPRENWPSHKGHELRGLKLINNLCDRLSVPNSWRELALLVAEFHTACHRALTLPSSTLLETLERVDALRRPERFDMFVLCCTADARGRTGLEKKPYPQADYMVKARNRLAEIKTETFIRQGYQGAQLGQKLREARLESLQIFKKAYEGEQ